MKSCVMYVLVALFGLLAIPQASAQSIVGAWTQPGVDETAEGAFVLVFFANGCFIQIQNAPVSEAPHAFDGFERGTYTWDPATGAFAVTVLQDLNGDAGLSNFVGLVGLTLVVSGDTATASVPGKGAVTVNRVTGASPIVGAWGFCSTAADNSAALVFLPNGVYFMAQDGDSTPATGDPSGHDGIEHGTYSWNQATGALTSSRTPAPYVDTNGEWGLSNGDPNSTFKVSADGLTLTISDGTDTFSAARVGAATSAAANYQGLWWKSDEPYWGVNLAHQGDRVFATWYTYDTSGNAYWLSMLAPNTPAAPNVYSGTINSNVGSPFSNYTGNSPAVPVGTGILTFSDANNGTFDYTITSAGGATNVHQTKAITRFSLGGPQPVCTYASPPDFAGATNYQDLWWVPTESGWGVNFAHQGDLLFATWYTYGTNNAPLWLSALMTRQGASNVFTASSLTRTSGPRFDNYKASDVVQPIPTVGTATAAFTDGNHATFTYATDGTAGLPVVTSQNKAITRFLYSPGATVCQ